MQESEIKHNPPSPLISILRPNLSVYYSLFRFHIHKYIIFYMLETHSSYVGSIPVISIPFT